MPKAADPVRPAQKAPARMSKKDPLTKEQVRAIDAWWRAANYLSACQLYLLDNPLLREPLKEEHLKRTIVGYWGTCPGQNFIYTHLNRAIVKYDLDMIYLSGPGHGGNAIVAQDYLDGSYSEVYPNISRDEAGMKRLFRQFAFPGGIPSHTAPETPGSINEGGELGYSLAHAFGAVMDNPDLIAACVVGDGEAETGPLAAAWHSNKFLNPITDGAVLPILHLNGFKIGNPTIFSRISREEAEMFFKGCGWEPRFVEGDEPEQMHPGADAPEDGRRPGLGGAGDPAGAGVRPHHRRRRPAPVAHDRLPLPQGLDRPQGSGRTAGGGQLALPPDPHSRPRRQARPRPGAGAVAEELPPRGAL